MNSPLVSVIIPNYCHSRFLEERIQSVLQQTYQDFELIILDDCSPDGGASREIIEHYRYDSRVSHIVYSDVNSGSSFKQWNKGIELARGEYIWIAESDDSCDKTLLEKLVNQTVRHQAIMTFCRSARYDVNGEKNHYECQDTLGGDFVLDGSTFVKHYLIDANCVANASSVVFRRDVALNVDVFYTQMKAEGDWLFWIQLALCGKVCFVNEPLNFFRFHAENTTKKNAKEGIVAKEHIHVFNNLVKSGFIRGREKHALRFSKTHYFSTLPLDKETMKEVMALWDPYHLYRALYPLVHAKGQLVEWIERKRI